MIQSPAGNDQLTGLEPPSAQGSAASAASRSSVAVAYEHSTSLPELLHQLEASVLLSTYQAGRVAGLI